MRIISFDPAYYLTLYGSVSISPPDVNSFREIIPREVHPWRRYFARILDYLLVNASALFVLVVVFRIRPFSSGAFRLLGFASAFLSTPILAYCVSKWGTTAGKWAFGIRLESVNGAKLSYENAFHREWSVLWYGFGLTVPIVSLILLLKARKRENNGIAQPWDEETEFEYRPMNRYNKWIPAVLMIAATALWALSFADASLPKHRGERLSMLYFSENLYDYEKTFGAKPAYRLNSRGVWERVTDAETSIGIDELNHPRRNYEFSIDQNAVRGFRYYDEQERNYLLEPLPIHCHAAIYAFVGSRPDSTHNTMKLLNNELFSRLNDAAEEACRNGTASGSMTVSDVVISWKLTMENCMGVSGFGFIANGEEENFRYILDLSVKLLQS